MADSLQKLLRGIVADVTGSDLAHRLGKSPSYVSQMLNGTQIPTPETLATLVAAFQVPERLPELLATALREQIDASEFRTDSDGSRKRMTLSAVERLYSQSLTPPAQPVRTTDRTLAHFPESFYPLAVITGDKREDRTNRISAADLGAYSATPGDTRWLLNLGLRPDVIKHIDKNFVLLGEDDLIAEFAEVNLLVVGSPASNHLARKVNSSAVFHFNYSPDVEHAIDEAIAKARDSSPEEIAAYHEQERKRLVPKMRSLFVGGMFDPTYPDSDYQAAQYAQVAMNTQLDFGVLTFAANPYYARKCEIEKRECDHKYVSIMAAGIHHPATAHALRLLGQDCRRKGVFDRHPYGGVIRVQLDLNVPFSKRTMEATCEWEDEADSGRTPSNDQKRMLLDQLLDIEKRIRKRELKSLALHEGQPAQYRRLIESL